MTSRPQIVVFGGGGFVGRHLRRLAESKGFDVVTVSRRTIELVPGESFVQGDVATPEALIENVPARSVIVNLAYDGQAGHEANLALADNLARLAAGAGASRLVHTSTAMVVGLADTRLITEQTACRPSTPYQRTKLAVEERLRQQQTCPLVIVRPTAVFGSEGLNLRKLVGDLTTRPGYENYLRSALFGTRPMNLVPVETVASAILFAAVSDQAIADGLYLVADDEADGNDFRHVETVLRRELGLGPYAIPPVPLPSGLLNGMLRLVGRHGLDSRTRFSSARLMAAGFERPVDFMPALVDYARAARRSIRADA